MITELPLQNLPNANQGLEAVFQAYGDFMFVVDEEGTILEQKSGDVLQLNISPQKNIHRKIQDLLPFEAGRQIVDGLSDLRAKNTAAQVEFSHCNHQWKKLVRIPPDSKRKPAGDRFHTGYYKI
ncbi:MAG: hypothetical protein IPN58_19060 [Anaerolineales bacterium]|nr:hypothetical protein [Anaerolineales bacterium]